MKNSNISGQQGFSLIEVLIAMVILGIGLLTLITMQTTGIMGNAKANNITVASDWGVDRMEQIFALDYDDDELKDDVNPTGAAGLDETGATADGTDTSPDGNYTISWNIADEDMMPNTKTIRVIIERSDFGEDRKVTMDNIKAKYF
jgi:type IV pilus assembly protein PilV